MYKHLLAESGNIEWMALLPLVIFVSFFVGLLLYVIRGNRKHFNEMAFLPFNENSETNEK